MESRATPWSWRFGRALVVVSQVGKETRVKAGESRPRSSLKVERQGEGSPARSVSPSASPMTPKVRADPVVLEPGKGSARLVLKAAKEALTVPIMGAGIRAEAEVAGETIEVRAPPRRDGREALNRSRVEEPPSDASRPDPPGRPARARGRSALADRGQGPEAVEPGELCEGRGRRPRRQVRGVPRGGAGREQAEHGERRRDAQGGQARARAQAREGRREPPLHDVRAPSRAGDAAQG